MDEKALFFDLDGTLTDPKIGITGCIQYALQKLAKPVPTKDELTWCIGPPLLESFVTLAGEEHADAAVGFYRERFSTVGLFENTPYAQIDTTLGELRARGSTLYVASSKPLVFVERILERFELREYFSGVYGAELDGGRSDKSELLEYALNDSAVVAEQATMIGDRKHDAIGAANNQMDFIGVLYGYGDRHELTTAGASVLVDSNAELLDLLA